MSLSLNKIIKILKDKGIDIIYNKFEDLNINNVNTIIKANSNDITFFHNIKYKEDLNITKAAACFVNNNYSDFLPNNCYPLITEDPYRAFIETLDLFYPKKKSNGKISTTAIIDSTSYIDQNVEIQDNVVIKNNVKIGKNTIIYPNTTIGENTIIDSDVIIESNCKISNCIISKFSNIQQGVVIGSDGFGFALNSDEYRELRHLGRVLIGKNVKIGSNSCIDRGTLNDTKIGNNVRIDNLVHIAHNVIIGNNCVIAGQTGIAGSTIIGENVIMGGQVGISGHLNIGDNVKIAAKSGVIKNISDNIIVGGYPAQKIKDWHRGTIKLYKKND